MTRWLLLPLLLYSSTDPSEVRASPLTAPALVAPAGATEPALALDPASARPGQETPVATGGTILGRVKYLGSPPLPEKIQVTKDESVCGDEQVLEDLVISQEGGVRNVLVSLNGIPKGKTWDWEEPVLDQKGCRYNPHALLLRAGSELTVLNSDGTSHNVHTHPERGRPVNRQMPKFMKKMTIKFEEAESIEFTCDVHSWMSAWVHVVDHPYHDLTNGSGHFRLEAVPPGEYTLEIWHPRLGTQTRQVRVEAGTTVEINFAVERPDK